MADKNCSNQKARASEPLAVGDDVRVEATSDPSKSSQEQKRLRDKRTFKKFAVNLWTQTHFKIWKIDTISGLQRFTLTDYEHQKFKRHQLQKVHRIR